MPSYRWKILIVPLLLILAALACNFGAIDQPAPSRRPTGPNPPIAPVPPQVAPPQRVALPPPTATPVLQGPDVESAEERAVGEQLDEANTGDTGQLAEVTFIDSERVDVINALSQGFYSAGEYVAPLYSVDRYRIQFQTLNEKQEVVPIRADLFIPRVDAETNFPVFVYGAGTTGIGNSCAPLDENIAVGNWGNYRTHMLSYAAQGYISILPLWQGYDDRARTHPYFISELEAFVMLDATRAVYNFFENPPAEILARPQNDVFFAGYSQGGHGAFAGDSYAASYAPDVASRIRGIIGHANAPSVEALLREQPALAPYIVYAYRDFYGANTISPEDVFAQNWIQSFYQDAAVKCVNEAYAYWKDDPNQMYNPNFTGALFGQRIQDQYPSFYERMAINDAGRAANPNTPALLAHGLSDPVVYPQTNQHFMRQLCEQGKPVTSINYPGVGHFQTRQAGFRDTLSWMRNILDGGQPRNDCGTLAAN